MVVADMTFSRLNYLTFIGNNPSIYGVRRTWLERVQHFFRRTRQGT